jgi:hypothetical protein
MRSLPPIFAASLPPRKSQLLPHQKSRAFSLPQHPRVELMFGAAGFGKGSASVSTASDFRMERQGALAARWGAAGASASFYVGFALKRARAPRHGA